MSFSFLRTPDGGGHHGYLNRLRQHRGLSERTMSERTMSERIMSERIIDARRKLMNQLVPLLCWVRRVHPFEIRKDHLAIERFEAPDQFGQPVERQAMVRIGSHL